MRRAVAAQGPQVSLDVVAESLGVTAPALSRRFGSRGALLLAALGADAAPPFLAHLEAGPDQRPIDEQLRDIIERVSSHMATALPCIMALRESGLDPIALHAGAEPPPLRSARALGAWLRRASDQALLCVAHPEEAAVAILGAIQAPIFLHHVAKREGAPQPGAYSQHLTDLILRGLGPRPPAPSETRSPAHDRPAPPSPAHAPQPAAARDDPRPVPVRAAGRRRVPQARGR